MNSENLHTVSTRYVVDELGEVIDLAIEYVMFAVKEEENIYDDDAKFLLLNRVLKEYGFGDFGDHTQPYRPLYFMRSVEDEDRCSAYRHLEEWVSRYYNMVIRIQDDSPLDCEDTPKFSAYVSFEDVDSYGNPVEHEYAFVTHRTPYLAGVLAVIQCARERSWKRLNAA